MPASLLPELVRPATSLGSLRPEVAGRTRLRRAVVVAPATHDTASAVTAVPFRQRGSVYISAGTWSLVHGARSPLISDEAFAANLTNEGGIDGTVRLLKNVNGLWLVHECRRAWADDGEALSRRLVGLAERLHRSSRCWIRTSRFSCSRDRCPNGFARRVRRSRSPSRRGLERSSDASSTAWRSSTGTIELLADVTGVVPAELHIVGGGARNALLCQATADATGSQPWRGRGGNGRREPARAGDRPRGAELARGGSRSRSRLLCSANLRAERADGVGRRDERFRGILRGTQAEEREVAAR